MKSVIVLSVSAWGAVFIFPEAALDLTVSSPMLRRRLFFPRGGEITVAKISSWLCSAHPAEALAQLLYEKSRLLYAAKWSPFFSSLSPLRRAFGRLPEGRL
jgi:hypothetical protein